MATRITLAELERMSHHENSHASKNTLMDYIAYLWWLLQDSDDEKFKADLQRDYKFYLELMEGGE